jgi:hypothetical protein
MKNTTIAICLLAGLSAALLLDEYCILDWIGKDCQQHVEPIDGCACNDKERYPNEKEGAGSYVTLNESRFYLTNFQEKYKVPKNGGFISKHVLDDVFCGNPNANGVFCYFGLTTKEPDSFVLLVESGTSDSTKANKTYSIDNPVFKAGVICPNICGDTPHH